MIGKTLAHYEITAKLGEGGMGEVYRAHDPRTGREVALKILPPAFAGDPERLARFRREARTLASLNHRSIATLYGVEEHDGQPFLVMEVAQGHDLAHRLTSGPIALDDVLAIALQMAEGLEEAHEKNVVHRDLKPANVMVDPDGVVKILDFGLARAYEGPSLAETDLEHSPTITANMTQAGTIMGTAGYMSPEQARGRGIDRRSDLWAFGVILWEMLTGKRLFQGQTVSDTLASVLRADLPWDDLPPDLPHGVRRLLERCLERDVRNRMRDIGEARIRLEKWQADPSSLQDSFVSAVSPAEQPRASRWLPWTVAAIATAVAVFFGLYDGKSSSPAPERFALEIRLDDDEHMTTARYAALDLSPDGQYFLWSTESGLYLRHRMSLESLFIPTEADVNAAGFSPNSLWIAYARSGRVYRKSVTGGAAIEICEAVSARGLTWADDETIVISPSYDSPLFVVNVADGSMRELTQLNPGERSHRWPSAVRGHDEVLFMTQLPGGNYENSDIEAVSLTGARRRTIYRGGAHPRYSPTGHLLFARTGALFAVGYEPGSETTEGLASSVLEGILTRVGDQELDDGSVQFGFDDQGTLIYREALSNSLVRSTMAWLDLATGETKTFGEPDHHDGARVSPDGKHVAVRRGLGAESQIIVHDLDNGAERTITVDRGTKYFGDWSADSTMVYWTQPNAGATGFEVRRARMDGSQPAEVVISTPHISFVETISPDGRWLLVAHWSPETSYDTVQIDLESAEPSMAPSFGGAGDQTLSQFSPNGRFIAYEQGLSGNFFVRRFPDTGARWRIGEPKFEANEVFWSARGDALFELSVAGIRVFPVEMTDDAVAVGRGEFQYEPEMLVRRNAGDADVHPDGKRLLILVPAEMADTETASRIVLRSGWFDDLRRIGAGGR